jgi:sugar lactone lactonase YvrE
VDGTLFTARFRAPRALIASGSSLLVADQNCHTVRHVALDANTVLTLAGQADAAGWADGVGTNAQFSSPQGAAADGTGNGLLVADTGNHALRLVTLSTGAVISLAGQGVGCFVDDVGFAACFNNPIGVSLAPHLGTVALVVDTNNCRLRSVNLATRAVSTFAGVACGSGIVDGPRGYGSFSTQLYSVAVNGSTAYVGDASALRAVHLDTGAVVTLAGGIASGFLDTAVGALALFSGSIFGLAVSLSDGKLLVADAGSQRVRAMGLANPFSVGTLAGSGVIGATDGAAQFTTWANPSALAFSAGTLYVADTANSVLRSMRCPTPSGTPSPTASLTRFASPSVSPTPTVTSQPSMSTSASSTSSYVGCTVANVAGLPGTAAWADGAGGVERFNAPYDIVYKAAGDVLLVADYTNNRIREVSATGAVTTVAGTGVAGTADGPATAARLSGPTGLALDASGANVFISDFSNHRIRLLATGGLSTLAGCCGATPTPGYLDAPGVNARFSNPSGLAADPAGTWLYVADFSNSRIRAVNLLAGAAVTTLAGSGAGGNLDGVGTNAQFFNPRGLALDASLGVLYVTEGHRVRIVSVSGAPTVTTLAGGGAAAGIGTAATVGAGNAADGTGTNALYNSPWGLAVQGNSVLMVAEAANNRIRSVVALPAGGALPLGLTTTAAGVGTAGTVMGPATAVASLTAARGLAINASSGAVFFVDNHAVRVLRCPPTPPPSPSPTPSAGASPAPTPTGTGTVTGAPTPTPTPSAPGFGCVVSALAGVAGTAGRADGVGGNALFNGPSGLAVDATGLLWVADRTSNAVRTVTPAGAVTTLAGSGAAGAVDGYGTSATFNAPTGVAVDATNTAWVADTIAAKIRRVTLGGWVSTFAGSGIAASVDGVGTSAQFSQPTGIAVTRLAGPVTAFVTDVGTHRVRAVAYPSAEVTTIAGTGAAGAVNAVGLGASFNTPRGLALDASETILYVSDTLNYRIRRIALATLAVTTLTPGTAAGCSDVAGTLGLPSHIALDASGSLLVADSASACFVVRRVTAAGQVWTVAGRGAAGAAVGAGAAAAFTLPFGVAVDSSTGSGAMYVSDQQGHVVRRLVCPTASPSTSPTPTPSPGASSSGTPTPTPSFTATSSPTPTQTSTNNGCILSTLAGSAIGGSADGAGAAASFAQAFSLTTSPSQGLLLVTDRTQYLRSLALDGSAQVSTLTGAAGVGSIDGTPTFAKFNSPGQADWVVGGGGAFLVTDTTNRRIRLVSAALVTTTLAGSGAAAWQDGLGSKSSAHPLPNAPERPRKSL